MSKCRPTAPAGSRSRAPTVPAFCHHASSTLRKAQVMRVCRAGAVDQTGLGGHISDVAAIAHTTRL